MAPLAFPPGGGPPQGSGSWSRGRPASLRSAGSRRTERVCGRCAALHMEHHMQTVFRDSRVGPIGGGSNEIPRNIIARLMGLRA